MKWRGGDAVTLVQTEIKESESPVRWGDYREHQCGWRSGSVDGKQWRRWTEVRQGAGEAVYGRGGSVPPPNTLHPSKCGGHRTVDSNSQHY